MESQELRHLDLLDLDAVAEALCDVTTIFGPVLVTVACPEA